MSWKKIQGDELERLQDRFEMPPQTTIREAATLRTPFYHNGELVRMTDGTSTMFMVAAGSGDLFQRDYYPLNGTGADIHAANKAAGLVLTLDNAIYYLLFFTLFLQMEDGEPCMIVESLDGYTLVNESRPGQRIPEDLRFICLNEAGEGDGFLFKGYMAYRGELFRVSMRVYQNGNVEMLDDHPMGRIVRLH
jgi:hypothetical protein